MIKIIEKRKKTEKETWERRKKTQGKRVIGMK